MVNYRMFQNAVNAIEAREPLSYKEVEGVMKRELRELGLYEFPRGVS